MAGYQSTSSQRISIDPEKLGPAGAVPRVATQRRDVPADAGLPVSFSDELLLLMPFLRAFARSLTRHREMAEDLAQEALAKAWQSRDTFVPGTNLKAWVFMIVRNQFYTDRRRAWRNQPWDVDVADKVLVSPSNQFSAVILSEVAAAINELPVLQQDAIILVGAGGLSYLEAAQMCGCAIGTVKSRVARARRAIVLATNSALAVPVSLRPAPGGAADAILCKLALTTASVAISGTQLAALPAVQKRDARTGPLCLAHRGAQDIGLPIFVPRAVVTDQVAERRPAKTRPSPASKAASDASSGIGRRLSTTLSI